MISHKKPHIFKDRHGVWCVIPARYRLTLWEKICNELMTLIALYSSKYRYRQYLAFKYRYEWNDFAEAFAWQWNKEAEDE